MKQTVRRVFNLQPILGPNFSTYEVTLESDEYNPGETNSKIILAYLNNLIEESFYHYLLNCGDLNLAYADEIMNRFKQRTKNRIKYQNKIYKNTGEN